MLSALLLTLTVPGASGQDGAPAPAPAPPADSTADGEGPVLPYTTSFVPTGSEQLDTAIQTISTLQRLQESAPTSAEGVVARALQEVARVQQALRSEGFYAGTPRIRIAGEAPDAPNLALRLAGRTDPVTVEVGAEPGPRYAIASATARPAEPSALTGPAAEDPALRRGEVPGLSAGDPARAEAVLGAEGRLLTRLRAEGYPFAGVPRRRVTVDHDSRTMEVVYEVQPGPLANFARPAVEGSENVDPRLLANVSRVLENERYSPDELDRVRRDILALGVFGTVRARTGDALDETGRLPVTYVVTERPFRAIGGTLGYETAYGPTVRAYWEHRNLFGAAERLRLEGEVSRAGQTGSSDDIGARISANLRKPWFGGLNLTMVAEIAAIRERLLAYDRDAVTASLTFERRIDPRLTLSAGVAGEIGETKEIDQDTRVRLLSLPLGARWDSTDNVLDPTRGLRGSLVVAPTYAFGEGGNVFVRIRGTGSTYFDLTGDKGTVLALRAGFGSLYGAEALDVPPHLRFYAGGGGSVRGYDFQRVGPVRRDNTPRGGLSLVDGSVELRQRITGPWGVAAFVDAGSVSTDNVPDFGNLRVGAGVGVRYATAIGPIRADVALPLSKVPGNSSFGLYVGIGQAF